MKKVCSVEEYIEGHPHYSEALILMRSIIRSTELEEHIKWNAPVYAINNKNVLSIGAFNNHFVIWFFNGVFLKDAHNLFKNVQDGKTKAMRQMRFESIEDIDQNIVQAYAVEAIQNQKLGKELKPHRTKKQVIIPVELLNILESSKTLKTNFESLSNSKQREYCEYIESAKREATKHKRMDKIIPMIKASKGLHDKYRNC